MTPVPFELIVTRTENATIITMRGDVSISAADALATGLLPVIASKPAHVILDLSDMPFISSLGLGQLVALRRGIAANCGRVTIVAPQERVLKALQHAKIDSMFQVVAQMPRPAPA